MCLPVSFGASQSHFVGRMVKLYNVRPVNSLIPDAQLVCLKVISGGLDKVWDIKNEINTLILNLEKWLTDRHPQLVCQRYVRSTLVTHYSFYRDSNSFKFLNE